MEKNIIYHGDCIEGMKILPDNSVDMVLTDPPYGTTQNKWDTVVDMDAFWKEIKRVTKKNSAILIFTQMPFTACDEWEARYCCDLCQWLGGGEEQNCDDCDPMDI